MDALPAPPSSSSSSSPSLRTSWDRATGLQEDGPAAVSGSPGQAFQEEVEVVAVVAEEEEEAALDRSIQPGMV